MQRRLAADGTAHMTEGFFRVVEGGAVAIQRVHCIGEFGGGGCGEEGT